MISRVSGVPQGEGRGWSAPGGASWGRGNCGSGLTIFLFSTPLLELRRGDQVNIPLPTHSPPTPNVEGDPVLW